MTERDAAALNFVGRMGFVLVEHLSAFLGCGIPRAYAVADRLVKSGELDTSAGVMRKKLYRVSGKYAREHGMTVAGDMSLSKYSHSVALVSLCLELMRGEFAGWEFITERELLRDALSASGGFSSSIGHLPDLVFRRGAEKTAVELELTRKTLGRMQKILNGYRQDLEMKKVIYYTPAENVAYLRRLTECDEQFEVRQWGK